MDTKEAEKYFEHILDAVKKDGDNIFLLFVSSIPIKENKVNALILTHGQRISIVAAVASIVYHFNIHPNEILKVLEEMEDQARVNEWPTELHERKES